MISKYVITHKKNPKESTNKPSKLLSLEGLLGKGYTVKFNSIPAFQIDGSAK